MAGGISVVEFREAMAYLAVEGGESAADHDRSICPEGQRIHRAVGAGVEGGVERAVRRKTTDMISQLTIQVCEGAAEQDFAVGLEGNGIDAVVGRRRKARIQLAVRIQAPDAPAGLSPEGGEAAADQNPGIGLNRHAVNIIASGATETGICRAVGVDPFQCGVDFPRIRDGNQHLAVCLGHQGIDGAAAARRPDYIPRAAIGVDGSQAQCAVPIQPSECAREDNRAIGSNSERVNGPIGRAKEERGVRVCRPN